MIKTLRTIILGIVFSFLIGINLNAGEMEIHMSVLDKAVFNVWKENTAPFIKLCIREVYDLFGEDSEYPILVNYRNPIPDGYKVTLKEVEKGHKLELNAAESLKKMLFDARLNGLSPVIVSSYRTNAKQESLFKNQIQKHMKDGFTYNEAFETARTIVAYPGTSEHQLGLAADIVSKRYQALDEKQEETPESVWLRENCAKYGFILRYPNGKSDITEIIYEPWHYRYVGLKAAIEMETLGLCLEEYVKWLNGENKAVDVIE